MAFLPEFETDIFISYARVDNKTATDGEGWVALFIKHLQTELDKLHGRMGEVKLWWDPTLDDNQLFDVKIQNQINSSAIFLALTSNGYLRSEYCRKEIRWFREQAEQNHGLKIGDRLRVVNVMLNNIPPKDWPDEFQGAIGSKFHDAEREDELGQPPLPGETLFREKLRKLSESIFRTLKEFQKIAEAPAPKPEPEDSFVVFLADVADSLQNRRDLVANELRQQGVRLLDFLPPPHEAAAHDAKLKTEIARADLAVHLLNEWGGRRMDGKPSITYPQQQVELGLQHAKSQLIWVPQSLNKAAIEKLEDATQRDLLARLEDGNREQSRYRFLRESPSAIAREVINQLEEQKRQQLEELERQKSKAQTESYSALIDTHLKDQLHAWELGRALTENKITPLINPPVDDPALSLKLLEDRLRQVSRLIILFGEVTEDWVRARLGEALSVAARTPGCPLKKFAVCFCAPQRKEKGTRFDLNFMPVQHFNLHELLEPRTMAEFLKG